MDKASKIISNCFVIFRKKLKISKMILEDNHPNEKKDLGELPKKFKGLMNVKYKNVINAMDLKDLYNSILN